MRAVRVPTLLVVCVVTFSAINSSPASGASATSIKPVRAVGAERQYADMISAIGGRFVEVSAVIANDSVDPHALEVTPSLARTIAGAALVVQNGLGMDPFMTAIESTGANGAQRVVIAAKVSGITSANANPHIWYRLATASSVARAIAEDLSSLRPAASTYFQSRLHRFDRSLGAVASALRSARDTLGGFDVATTEPVADYLIVAMGGHILTPSALALDFEDGIDPTPQNVAAENRLLNTRQVQVFVVNRQVTDSLTSTFVAEARREEVPIVGVYETMPHTVANYQDWMFEVISRITSAVTSAPPKRNMRS